MRSLTLCIALFLSLAIACQRPAESAKEDHTQHAAKNDVAPDSTRKSIPKEEHAQIAGTHFTIRYHAPAVRGRTIWGGLVPYDDVWVTGAHSATSVEFDKEITVNETVIPAGKYAIFTIPRKDKWTIIINRNWDQHLADEYDPKDDIVRVEATPEVLADTQERLNYSIVPAEGSKAMINISWEKVRVTLPIGLN